MFTLLKDVKKYHCYFLGETHIESDVTFFPGSVICRLPMAPKGLTQIDYSKLKVKPVYVGDNTVIGANCVIYNDVKIGKNCLIGDGVYIREGVSIGDNCIIGISTKIGARTTIGNSTRIMDLSNVASDAIIGNNVFIGPAVVMGNDNSMGRVKVDGFAHKGPVIDDWATIGMNATILPGKHIGKDVLVAAGAVVTKDIEDFSIARGVPAKVIGKMNKEDSRC